MIAPKSSRLFARILDYFIIGLMCLPNIVVPNTVFGFPEPYSIFYLLLRYGVLVLNFIALLYFLFMDCLPNGQSIGKKIFKIAVVNIRKDKKCNVFQSVARNIFLGTIIVHTIEVIAILLSANGRRIGDRLARTIVIRTDNGRQA
jgi:uncharacterized RDD family membrane protein YckC